jgi:hypothetical protein
MSTALPAPVVGNQYQKSRRATLYNMYRHMSKLMYTTNHHQQVLASAPIATALLSTCAAWKTNMRTNAAAAPLDVPGRYLK